MGRHLLRSLLLIVLIVTGAIAGCGQKGPLYLPDEDQRSEERND